MVDTSFAKLSRKSLSLDQDKIVSAASEVLLTSYSPYSNFQVGAALLLDDGKIFTGSNQENMAYPSGICAERNALFAYGASGVLASITKLAVIARHQNDPTLAVGAPCGACRQVMLEYELKQKSAFEVIFYYEHQFVIASCAQVLLPFHFHMNHYNK